MYVKLNFIKYLIETENVLTYHPWSRNPIDKTV